MEKRLLHGIVGMFLVLTHTAGAEWVRTKGLLDSRRGEVYSLAVMESTLFTGTSDGLYRTTDSGENWIRSDSGLVKTAKALAGCGTTLFAGTSGDGIFLSTDKGTSWNAANNGIASSKAKEVSSLVVWGGTVFAGTGAGVWFSSDTGSNWSAVDSGFRRSVLSLAVSAGNVYAATSDGVFQITRNNTIEEAGHLGNYLGTGVSIAVIDNTIFAGSNFDGIYVSTDNGLNWNAANTGIANKNGTGPVDVYSLLAVGSAVFAGAAGSLFLSVDNGAIWEKADSGLPVCDVNALAVNGTNIFAGTDMSGVWRRPLAEMVDPVNAHVRHNSWNQIGFKAGMSNRAGSKVNIAFTILRRGPVRVALYTPSGRELSVVVDQQVDAGTYRYTWNSSSFPQGCYVMKMHAGAIARAHILTIVY